MILIEASSPGFGLGRHNLPSNCVLDTMTKEETSMRFYTQTHQFYCGIDLHGCRRLVQFLLVLNRRAEGINLTQVTFRGAYDTANCRLYMLLLARFIASAGFLG